MRSEAPTPAAQLVLPLPGVATLAEEVPRIPRSDRVFVNRHLKMAQIDWVGFDMDYTLAVYDQAAMDALSIELTVERLIERGYPRYLAHLDYDARFPIRGLLIDKRHGHVLKMDRYKVVLQGHHGLRRLDRDDVDRLYHHKRIRPHTVRYHWIDTLFGLSEVSTYAAVVDAMEKRGARIDFAKLFGDIRESIDHAHRDGSVYSAVTANLPRFVERDEGLARTLHKLRSAGKKIFLLTNSPSSYTQTMLDYLLGGAMPEYPSWRHYFDVVIAAAQKPSWFQEGRPLMEREGEILRNVRGSLERFKIYEGGNLADFERLVTGAGSRVLYVGDHIYGDILRSKKDSSWRTAMIIPELGAEIAAHESCIDKFERLRRLEEARDRLEDELRYYQARFKELSKSNGESRPSLDADKVRTKRALERVRGELRSISDEHQELHDAVDREFHPYWGSLLKERHEMSSFGVQVELYADIYMRRVSCLAAYSPQQFFRSLHDLMPHEI